MKFSLCKFCLCRLLYISSQKKMHRGFELFIDKTAFEKSYYDLAIEAGKRDMIMLK